MQNTFAGDMEKLQEDLEMRGSPIQKLMQKDTFANVKEVFEKYRLNNHANEAPLASLHSIAAKTTRGVVNILKALKSDGEGKGD